MKNYLVFDCINTDRLLFNAGEMIPVRKSYKFFTTDDSGIEDKVTEESEEKILKWLCDHFVK